MRRRLFGVVLLAVWVGGMYVVWGHRQSVRLGIDLFVTHWSETVTYGIGDWLIYYREESQSKFGGPMYVEDEGFRISPRGLAAALIMTAVSSLILYVAWRAAVSAFTCAAGTCDACGYDLTGLAKPRCPECGEMREACA